MEDNRTRALSFLRKTTTCHHPKDLLSPSSDSGGLAAIGINFVVGVEACKNILRMIQLKVIKYSYRIRRFTSWLICSMPDPLASMISTGHVLICSGKWHTSACP